MCCAKFGSCRSNGQSYDVVVLAALASQKIHETWTVRELGKVPRSAETLAAFVELLATDVLCAIEKNQVTRYRHSAIGFTR